MISGKQPRSKVLCGQNGQKRHKIWPNSYQMSHNISLTSSQPIYSARCPYYRVHPLLWASDASPVRAELTLWTATWLQAPGAAPQSTTLYPGCKSPNLSSISSSLKALLHRKFWAWEALTYGSLSCRCTQRCSEGVFPFSFFIKHTEECRDPLCTRKHHIVLTVRDHVYGG